MIQQGDRGNWCSSTRITNSFCCIKKQKLRLGRESHSVTYRKGEGRVTHGIGPDCNIHTLNENLIRFSTNFLKVQVEGERHFHYRQEKRCLGHDPSGPSPLNKGLELKRRGSRYTESEAVWS